MRKLICLLLCLLFMGTALSENTTADTQGLFPIPDTPSAGIVNDTDADAYITLTGDSAQISGNGAAFDKGVLCVSQSGVYSLTGTLNGFVLVDSPDEDKVTLILNGVSLTSESSCIVILSSGKNTTVTLPEGSVNLMQSDFQADALTEDGAYDAVIYSKEDVKIKGSGALYLVSNGGKGINCRDDLTIQSGSVYVSADDDGMIGKDSVSVFDGLICIESEADGIKSSNEEKEGKGTVTVSGGEIKIDATNDAIQAYGLLSVSGGTVCCTTGGGAGTVQSSKEPSFGPGGSFPGNKGGGFGRGNNPPGVSNENEDQTEESAKGLKSDTDILISGGSITVDAKDDAVHSNGNLTVNGGTLTLSSGDDGIHADNAMYIQAGDIHISKSFEGLEAADLNIVGGTVCVYASDDGINAAGGEKESSNSTSFGHGGRGGFGGGMMSETSGTLTMTGGYVTVTSAGDGVDVNGDSQMSGGMLIIYGPENNGNAALDYDGVFSVSGGTLLATGSSGMAQAVTATGNVQMLAFTCGIPEGTILHIQDENQTPVCTFESQKSFSCVILVSELIHTEASYDVYAQGEYSLPAHNGLYTNGDYTPGVLLGTINL